VVQCDQRGRLAGLDRLGITHLLVLHLPPGPRKNYEIPEQLAFYRELALRRPFEGSPTEMGVAYDTFDLANASEVNAIISLALETNASVITTHAGGSKFPCPRHQYLGRYLTKSMTN